jgi:hypothetical protein
MIYYKRNALLFNDFAILENALGKGSLNVSSVNANCDCHGYSEPITDKSLDTDKITEPSGQAN